MNNFIKPLLLILRSIKKNIDYKIACTILIFPILSSCELVETSTGLTGQYNPPPAAVTIYKIYSINEDGGGLKLLSLGSNASFSSDGSKIYYWSTNSTVYSIDLNGQSEQQILTPNTIDYSVSEDGNKIVFSSGNYPNAPNIYTENSDGINIKKLTNVSGKYDMDLEPDFSPDASQIVFRQVSSIAVMASDGSDQRVILPSSAQHYYQLPKFSPSGNIIYVYDDSLDTYLQMYNQVNHQVNTLFSFSSFDTPISPGDGEFEISYKTNKVLVVSHLNGNGISSFLYQINLDNLQVEKLIEGYDAFYSLDGNEISYMLKGDTTNSIYVYNLSTLQVKSIHINLPGNEIHHPKLSLEGGLLIFEADSVAKQ